MHALLLRQRLPPRSVRPPLLADRRAPAQHRLQPLRGELLLPGLAAQLVRHREPAVDIVHDLSLHLAAGRRGRDPDPRAYPALPLDCDAGVLTLPLRSLLAVPLLLLLQLLLPLLREARRVVSPRDHAALRLELAVPVAVGPPRLRRARQSQRTALSDHPGARSSLPQLPAQLHGAPPQSDQRLLRRTAVLPAVPLHRGILAAPRRAASGHPAGQRPLPARARVVVHD